MREMKDSGIEWIGQIPKGWEVCRLKDIIKLPLQYGANESGIKFEKELPRYVRITDIHNNKLKENIEKQSLKESQAEGYILEHNDILFARSGATVGKSFLYQREYGRCAFAGYLIRAKINSSNNPKFIYYFTQSHAYDEWKNQVFIQATIQNIGADKYSLLSIALPELNEQQRIATFLDEKCKDIDTLITLQEEMIAELQAYKQSVISEAVTKGLNPNVPMKDSGVEWIGTIPEHWEICRLKNQIEGYKAGPFGSTLITNKLLNKGNILIYTPEHIANQSTINEKNLYLPDSREIELSQFSVTPGDIIFPIVGSLGRSMLITDNMPKGIINQRLAKFRTKDRINLSFFLWLFSKSEFYHRYINQFSRGSFILNLTKDIIYNMPTIIPPLPEQRQIADYLDTKCSQIDELIALKQQKITELQDYKKSLIYEYVTGKKEVPDNN